MDVEGFRQADWERNSFLASAALLWYEHFLQLGNEIEFFWLKRWSFGKCLFLWSRYYSLAYNTSCAYGFMQMAPTFDVSTKFFRWQDTGTILQMITTHVILTLRIYAMYGRDSRIMYVLILVVIGEATTMGVIFGVPMPSVIGTNAPLPGVLICADADPPHHRHWIMYYWVSVLGTESVLLSMALWKAWKYRSTQCGLMEALTRDSVLYFVAIFGIYLANLVLWAYNRITLDELGTSYSLVVSAILANKLMIGVRTMYYNTDHAPTDFLPSMHFEGRIGAGENQADTNAQVGEEHPFEIELDRFHDGAGF